MKFSFIRSRVGTAMLALSLCVLSLPVMAATTVSVAEQLSRVEMALDERDTKGARAWLQPLLERNDLVSARRAEALWFSARLERMDGDNDAAMEAIGAAVDLAREAGADANSVLVQLLRDRVMLDTLADQTEARRDDLRELVTLGSKAGEPQVIFDTGVLALRLVDPDKSVGLLATFMLREGAERNGVNLSSGALALADALLANGDGKAALQVYDRLVEAHEQGSAAFTGRAGAHILLGQAAEARADLEAARAQVKREASSLDRDLAVEGVMVLTQQLDAMAPSAETPADDWQAQLRAAIDAGRWEDARKAAESAIMRDRNAVAPRAALAEVYLLQGEYDGAVNVFASMSGLAGDSRFPRAGGNLAQALKGGEVYDVEGFAEDWITLQPAQKALLRRTVQAARERGPLPATAGRVVAVIEFRASSDKLP